MKAEHQVAYVHSVAFWSPHVDPAEPDTSWVSPRLLRGASRFTNMLLHTAERAVREGGGDSKTVATVYGSQYGEIETMCVLLDSIFRGDGQLSPMRFKNSVHNAGSGLGSIGQENRAFSTAIAAAERTLETCWLEAWSVLFDATIAAEEVVIVIADDEVPEVLAAADDTRAPLAVAILLSRSRPSEFPLTLSLNTSSTPDWPEQIPIHAGERLPTIAAVRENPAAHAARLAENFLGLRHDPTLRLFLDVDARILLTRA